MLNLREPYSPFSTTTFEAFTLRGTLKANYIFYYPTKITLRDKGMPRYPTPHMPTKHTKKPENKTSLALILPYPSGRLQYQSSFYKPKTYKDMEEKTLFKLVRAITNTGTDTVSSKGGTVTYRITSLKRKLVNGKVVLISTPSLDQMYIQGLSATGTTTMRIPFYANDSEPGSRIECTTGDKVAVYTNSGATWISKGSFIVPSAGKTVSI